MTNTIEVKLKDEMTYASKGDSKKALFVSLRKPTAKHIHLTCIIKNAFQSGASEVGDKVSDEDVEKAKAKALESLEKKKAEAEEKGEDFKEDEGEGLTPEDALKLLYKSPDSVVKAMIAFKELMREVCEFDGDQRATLPMIDDLSVEDFENILGEYLVNFILASLLKNQRGQ